MNTGGSAFPISRMDRELSSISGDLGGITKRDYFAAAALTGILANRSCNTATVAPAVVLAYVYADAMLDEREPYIK